jgi:glycosyltransferase involved in cell wall biosynthesis
VTDARERPRTVLLMTDEIDVGGKRSYVDILKAGLEEIGWRVHLINWASLSWPERIFAAGGYHILNAISPGLGHRWLFPVGGGLLGLRVRAVLAGPAPPDLIHVQESFTYAAARSAHPRVPLVMTVHGRFSLELVMVTGLPVEHRNVRFMQETEGRAFRGADRLFVVDKTLERYVRTFGVEGDVTVVTNFIDVRRFHPAVPPARHAEDVERWIAGRRVVFCTRRLVSKNGIDVAIRAASLLKEAGEDVAFIIAGDGPQRAELDALVDSLGVAPMFRMIGEISHDLLPGLYRRADIVIIPSVPRHGVEEGSSISALEGLAAGRPTIASASGGLVEMILDGFDGILVAPNDPAALADAIRALLRDEARAEAMGRAAADRIDRERGFIQGARRYAALYEEALAEGGESRIGVGLRA